MLHLCPQPCPHQYKLIKNWCCNINMNFEQIIWNHYYFLFCTGYIQFANLYARLIMEGLKLFNAWILTDKLQPAVYSTFNFSCTTDRCLVIRPALPEAAITRNKNPVSKTKSKSKCWNFWSQRTNAATFEMKTSFSTKTFNSCTSCMYKVTAIQDAVTLQFMITYHQTKFGCKGLVQKIE